MDDPQAQKASRVRFDDWVVDRDTGQLWKGERKVRLQDQPWQILDELVTRPGRLVTRQQLIRRLWPQGVVEYDTSLNTAVHKLRTTLGDTADDPRYIVTVPRKGYRFIGTVVALPADSRESVSGDVIQSNEQGGPLPVEGAAPLRLARYRTAAVGVLVVALAAWGALELISSEKSTRAPPPSASNGLAVESAARPVQRLPSSLAFERYLQARARQSEIAPFEPVGPRQQVLDLLAGALEEDPTLADAHVVRARTHLDFFMGNVDVSAERLAMVQADIASARRVAGDDLLGRDVEALYATYVELDPDAGLAVLSPATAADDPAALRAKGLILATIGRFADSNAIFEQLLSIDPADQRLLRILGMNLHAERRFEELYRLRRTLEQISPPPRNLRQFTIAMPSDFGQDRPSLARLLESASRVTEDGEDALALLRELEQLRYEARYDEIQRVLERISATTVRVGVFGGTLPGLGRRPVAELRAWNALLRGDAASAAGYGREMLDFLAEQTPTPWNGWFLQMLHAEAHLFLGNGADAITVARDAMTLPPERALNVYTWAYREFLAALVLGWAGERDDSTALLEKLARSAPSIGPAIIARDPLVFTPLTGHARYDRLRKTLEAEIEAYQAL